MWKPIRLQGRGDGSTIINAAKVPAEKLVASGGQKVDRPSWRPAPSTLLPGQAEPAAASRAHRSSHRGGTRRHRPRRGTSRQSGRLRARSAPAPTAGRTPASTASPSPAATTAAASCVNGYARLARDQQQPDHRNQGFYGGGIRIGHPALTNVAANGTESYVNAQNDEHPHPQQPRHRERRPRRRRRRHLALHRHRRTTEVTVQLGLRQLHPGDGGGIGHLGAERRRPHRAERDPLQPVLQPGQHRQRRRHPHRRRAPPVAPGR